MSSGPSASSGHGGRGRGVRRETLIAPLGYMTTPNQYGVFPEGALAQAENVLLRYKGKLVTAPSLTTLQNAGNGGTTTVFRATALDAGFLCFFGTNGVASPTYFTDGTTSGFATMPLGMPAPVPDMYPYVRTSPIRSRDRLVVNTNYGVIANDFMSPSNSTQRTFRWAGLPQPNLSQWSELSGVATYPIPNNIMVGYAACVTREFSDGYIVKSVPSAGYKYLNDNGGPALVSFRVYFETGTLAAGDFVEVYRTDGISTTSNDADPGTTYKLIARVALTSSDIATGYLPITDRWSMVAPYYTTNGKELYTNPYQEGTTGANRQPDINGAQAVYKGFTFYANLTERAQATIAIPGGVGDVAATIANPFMRANGIGGRTGSGTVTSGSNVITGVSAADIAGVRVGQRTRGSSPFPGLTQVTAVGASTITMSANATAPATVWTLYDWIEGSIGGHAFSGTINGASDIVELFTLLTFPFEINANQAITAPVNSNLTQGLVITIEPALAVYGAITLRASGGSFYNPPLPDTTQTVQTFSPVSTPNLMRWSKDSEPEHVPASNESRVGSGKIISLVSTQDALWIFCTDGVFRLSGDAGVWRIDVVAPGCVLCSPGCAVSMRDEVYAYTNYGFVAVTDSGIVPISDLQIKDQLPGPPYAEGLTPNGFLINNDDDEEVLVCTGFPSNIAYIYNKRQGAFTYIQNATGFANTTAGVFQQLPTSGGASSVVVISSIGGVPKYGRWTANTSWLAPVVEYRTMYAKNPMSTKQWVDAVYIFDTTNSGQTVTASFSAVTAGSGPLKAGYNDSYLAVGVPRAWAISASLQPGWFAASLSSQLLFEGISVRVVDAGIQQVRR